MRADLFYWDGLLLLEKFEKLNYIFVFMNGVFIKIKAKIRFKISSIKKNLIFVFLMTFEKF